MTTVLACRLPRTSAQTSARHHAGATHPIGSLRTERSAVQRLALTELALAADWHMACERCAGRQAHGNCRAERGAEMSGSRDMWRPRALTALAWVVTVLGAASPRRRRSSSRRRPRARGDR